MRLTLRNPEGSCTFWKITQGKKWIGRVYRHDDGYYVGKIRDDKSRGNTPQEAFDNVGAKFFGYPSVDALRAHNHQVASHKRVAKQRAQYAFNEIMKGNFKPLDELLGLKK